MRPTFLQSPFLFMVAYTLKSKGSWAGPFPPFLLLLGRDLQFVPSSQACGGGGGGWWLPSSARLGCTSIGCVAMQEVKPGSRWPHTAHLFLSSCIQYGINTSSSGKASALFNPPRPLPKLFFLLVFFLSFSSSHSVFPFFIPPSGRPLPPLLHRTIHTLVFVICMCF